MRPPLISTLLMRTRAVPRGGVRAAVVVSCVSLVAALGNLPAAAFGPADWSPEAMIPPQGRRNVYRQSEREFLESVRRGRQTVAPSGLAGLLQSAVGTLAAAQAAGAQDAERGEFRCALCHVGTLFGRPVVGLPRRRTLVEEAESLAATVGLRGQGVVTAGFPRLPVAPGLDASLTAAAHVLSKARPLAEPTGRFVGQTKPLPWWTLKYKTTWLADGSLEGPMVPGIYVLGESGGGTSPERIDRVLDRDAQRFRDVTAALFDCDPPAYCDFFPAATIDLAAAKRGQHLFRRMCSRCHGDYAKAWDRTDADSLGPAELLRTEGVHFPEGLQVHDVGTDSTRWQLMPLLAEPFNELPVSRRLGLRVVPRAGYVPPPLVGVWARWPYFHNNSAPSLYAVLTPGDRRPTKWWVVDADKPGQGFDATINGFPPEEDVPLRQRVAERLFDTTRPGAGNRGHDRDIFIDDRGRDLLTHESRLDLIEFLKTL
jgi:mono/diheme cytochrome c family protein